MTYLNSGDWIENLTALEYNNGEWIIYKYEEAQFTAANVIPINKNVPELVVVTDEVNFFFTSLK